MTLTMERPVEVSNEHNHSCIPGVCSVPCPYVLTEVDTALMPGMTSQSE